MASAYARFKSVLLITRNNAPYLLRSYSLRKQRLISLRTGECGNGNAVDHAGDRAPMSNLSVCVCGKLNKNKINE